MANPAKREVTRELVKRIRNTVTIGDMVAALMAFHEYHAKDVQTCRLCLCRKPYHIPPCPMIHAFKITEQIHKEENQ